MVGSGMSLEGAERVLNLMSLSALWSPSVSQLPERSEACKTRRRKTMTGTMITLFSFLFQRFDAVIEALEKGHAVDLSGLPPSPAEGRSPTAPVKQPSPGPTANSTPPASTPTGLNNKCLSSCPPIVSSLCLNLGPFIGNLYL